MNKITVTIENKINPDGSSELEMAITETTDNKTNALENEITKGFMKKFKAIIEEYRAFMTYQIAKYGEKENDK